MSTAQARERDTAMPLAPSGEQYLTFMLGGVEYGVNILRVQEIRSWEPVTPIPNAPECILGVINLRGSIAPIVDLRKRFALACAEYGPTTVVVVVNVRGDAKQRTVGLVVDGVAEVYDLAQRDLEPPPDFGAAVDTAFVTGLATVDSGMVVLLDIDRLVNAGIMGALDAPAG